MGVGIFSDGSRAGVCGAGTHAHIGLHARDIPAEILGGMPSAQRLPDAHVVTLGDAQDFDQSGPNKASEPAGG
jgi:hypothetical protein